MALQVSSHSNFLVNLFLKHHFLPFAAGMKALRDVGINVVSVDPASDPECAAEAAALTRWHFQEFKSPTKKKADVDLVLHGTNEIE